MSNRLILVPKIYGETGSIVGVGVGPGVGSVTWRGTVTTLPFGDVFTKCLSSRYAVVPIPTPTTSIASASESKRIHNDNPCIRFRSLDGKGIMTMAPFHLNLIINIFMTLLFSVY